MKDITQKRIDEKKDKIQSIRDGLAAMGGYALNKDHEHAERWIERIKTEIEELREGDSYEH